MTMTETAKHILIVGALLITVAGGTYLYLSGSMAGRHEITDF